MGITSNLAASRLIQPGVIASSSERPAAPYEGQVVYQKDTNQLLVWDGAAWVIPNQTTTNPEGLELVTSVTCSSGGTASGGIVTIGSGVSSIVLDNAFSTTYDSYKITVSGGAFSTNENMRLKLGSSTTGYYDTCLYSASNALTTVYATGTANTATEWARVGTGGANGIQVDLFLTNPGLAKYTSFWGSYLFTGTTVYPGVVAGIHSIATAYTGMTFSPGSGTITGGTIRVYGYRNS